MKKKKIKKSKNINENELESVSIFSKMKPLSSYKPK